MNKKNIVILVIFAFIITIVIVSLFFVKKVTTNNSNAQSYQEEIIENSEKHKDDFKSLSDDLNEKVVAVTFYSREIFDRTEHALGIKYSDFKNLNADKSNLKNESKDLTSDSKNFIQEVISDLKNNNISELVKLTDPKTIKIVGETALIKKYSQRSQYFKDYKSYDINSGFATTLVDDSIVFLESFINNKGENNMFGIVLSKTNSGYLLNEIFSGETSIIVAFPPEQNKPPIIIANSIKGFDRKDLAEIGGNILMPKGWYFKHELRKGTEVYFISREEIIGDNGLFETGLTLNAFKKQNIPGGDAGKYMNLYADEFIKHKKIESEKSSQVGDFSYRDIMGTFNDNGFSVKEILRVVANKKTNTLYIIIFESTPEKWDIEWNTKGKTILEYLSLDSTY